MRPGTKFTPPTILQIRGWVDQGIAPSEIALKLGCTLGTLRVRCSQFGISLRRPCLNTRVDGVRPANSPPMVPDPPDQLTVLVPRATLQHLRTQATAKGVSDSEFAAALLEKIAEDDLFAAVLDDS